MAPTFEDIIQSPQFTFFIGQEGKPIVVHASAIAATSDYLDALINNGMKESETRCARIEDVGVDDFIRFCEYAYRGDYTVPPWEEVLPKISSPLGESHQSEDDDGWASLSRKKKKKKGKTERLAAAWNGFDAVLEPAPEPEAFPIEVSSPVAEAPAYAEPYDEPVYESKYEAKTVSRTLFRTQFNTRNYLKKDSLKDLILQDFEPKSNTSVDQDFTPVFLAHARLYSFAHLRLIMPLIELTLHKLHKTLMNFKLYQKRVGDIIQLARSAYSNPDLPDRSDDGTIDDLRKLVVDYIVCEIDTIGKCDEFIKFMEEGGEFVGDFWRIARDYMA